MCSVSGLLTCIKKHLKRFSTASPSDYNTITYNNFLKQIRRLEYRMHDKLRMKLEDYMNCTIEYLGQEKPCNMDHVMGSFYTKNELP
ncbi:unnamed protein product, partial [Larinioides sclopetarius]